MPHHSRGVDVSWTRTDRLNWKRPQARRYGWPQVMAPTEPSSLQTGNPDADQAFIPPARSRTSIPVDWSSDASRGPMVGSGHYRRRNSIATSSGFLDSHLTYIRE
jgi:hypothetical protein